MKGIAEWLASIGLSEYAQWFADKAIDVSVVRDLRDQDLKDVGFARRPSRCSLEYANRTRLRRSRLSVRAGLDE